ncbi:hypothetical protein [Paenibacillus qinlingensis]|uniref:hypothetical protein n=1 Tax=Paenibacillus qinlingensis TaxID=1837343 RepID=UPI001567B1AF|nr:hypothetical protein [Paenibacillus qinlingensis]NQX57529.1 hypothetical protein [Paenibacillus qinlingensis]
MPATISVLNKVLKTDFWMRNRHDRPSDADIQAAGMQAANEKAKNEDIGIVQAIIPNAKFDHVDYVSYDIIDLEQHKTWGTNERHWQCHAFINYKLFYTEE